MIATWVFVCIFIIAAFFICFFVIRADDFEIEHKSTKVVICTATIIICIAICSALLWFLYSTESGARARKTFKSETQGGLKRTVKVYDMEGDLLEEYSGKFDVEEDADAGIVKVKFDNNGKRSIIYCSTGTVIIDEK